jgi:hypothetical protein
MLSFEACLPSIHARARLSESPAGGKPPVLSTTWLTGPRRQQKEEKKETKNEKEKSNEKRKAGR